MVGLADSVTGRGSGSGLMTLGIVRHLAWAGLLLVVPAWGQQGAEGISIVNRTSEVQACRVRSDHSDWSGYQSIAPDFAITIQTGDAKHYYIECQPHAKASIYAAKSGDHFALTATGEGPAVLQRIDQQS
ncbi:hypothetical protein [Sphingobium bisphenolivorans]|uniref:hypothetical protein n=1 Tax=Sphingobium bisphenolivorans TaxID=1335760 RepID=UPI0003B4D01B|nr:hypothetical protein [Sphingobium bisphenolivorans]